MQPQGKRYSIIGLIILFHLFVGQAHSMTCTEALQNTTERLSRFINSPAEQDTKSIRFYLVADRKGIENLSDFGGFGFPNGKIEIQSVTSTANSSSKSVSTGENNLYLSSLKSLPAFKILNRNHSQSYPQDVVLVFPYGYLVRAKLHKRSFTFITGNNRLYLTDLSTMNRNQWSETRPDKGSTDNLKNSSNNIFIAQRAKAQIEFSNTFVSGASEDQIGIYEAQRKMYETFTRLLENNTPLDLNSLAVMNTQVGLYISKIQTYYNSDVAPYPFDGYETEYALAPEEIVAVAGQYRASNSPANLQSTMGPNDKALINFLPPQYVLEEMRQLIDFINSLDQSTDLHFVAYAYKTFLSIHPFANGNGRMARALLDYMLIKTGYVPPKSYNENLAWVHWQSVEEVAFNLSEAVGR